MAANIAYRSAPFSWLLLLAAVAVAWNIPALRASDPDPVVDFAPAVSSFVLRDIFVNGQITMDTGGIRAAVTPEIFPAINNEGITYVRVRIVPCGSQLAHWHPRATEILTLISGGPLQVGFIDTQGTAHLNILYPGDITVFPRGLLHYELNVGLESAEYISALNSQNPGTLTAGAALFKVPLRALATSLNLPKTVLLDINSTLAQYVGASLKKVGRSGCVPGRDITIEF